MLIRFRNGEAYTAAKSKEQQHSFNIPYQISVLPGQKDLEKLKQVGKIEEFKKLKKVLKRVDNLCQDKPEYSDEYNYELQEGDIIISCTDGVFDNLFSHEILKICREFKQKHPVLDTADQAKQIAEKIVADSLDKVRDKKKRTPYQMKYKKTYNANWEVSESWLNGCVGR